jgi:hypothetical protein
VISCRGTYTGHNNVFKGCGVVTTEDNNMTDRQAVASTVHNDATDTREVMTTVDNNSGVNSKDNSVLEIQTHMRLSM